MRAIPSVSGGVSCCASVERRRRWSEADLRYLDNWAGTSSVAELCRHLQRSERAVRCQLHRCGLSAKVCEGWSVADLRTQLHVSVRTVRRCVVAGVLRVQSAQVHVGGVRASSSTADMLWPAGVVERPAPRHAVALEVVAQTLHWPRRRVFDAVLKGCCRVTHLRVTEASVRRLVTDASFDALRVELSPALRCWLDEGLR